MKASTMPASASSSRWCSPSRSPSPNAAAMPATASGRFFWPVWYLLPLGAIWLLHRGFGPRATRVLVVLLAALQVYDTYPGWSVTRTRFELAGNTYPTSLDDPALAAIASHYRVIRR